VFWLAALGAALFLGAVNSDAPAAEPQTELIFPLQGKHVHSSSIVQLKDGSFLACWFYGSGERSANDVRVQGARLAKGASSWSPVFLMVDTPNLPDCNPVLYVDRREHLWLFWIVPVANRWERSVLKYRRAEDYLGDGAPRWSWQDSIHLVPGEAFAKRFASGFRELKSGEARYEESMWAEYAVQYSRLLTQAAADPVKRQTGWMTRTHPLELPSGRFLVPLYSDGFNACLMAISDDGGGTWRASQPIIGLGPIQPSVVREGDGTLVAYMRDSGARPGRVLRATSSDEGETWSVALDTEIPNPGASVEAIRLRDGRWVMAYNDDENGRNDMTLALSDDEGKTWKWKRTLEDSPDRSRSFAYPSLIQSADELLHLTYSFKPGQAAIKHASFTAEWITGQ
jgi:predicted neuraminidase